MNLAPRRALLVCIALIQTVYSSECTADSISEPQFIEHLMIALKEGWDFETDRIDVEIKEVELRHSKQRYSGFKLDLKSSIDVVSFDRVRRTTSNTLYTKEADSLERAFSIEASKQFLSNPSRLILSFDKQLPKNDYKRYRQSSYNDTYETYSNESQITIKWLFPILKHSNSPGDLRAYRRDQLDLQDTLLSFLENQEDFISEQLKNFFELGRYQAYAKVYDAQVVGLEKLLKGRPSNPVPIERSLIEIQKDFATIRKNQKSLREDLSIRLNIPELTKTPVQLSFIMWDDSTKDLHQQLMRNNRSLKKIQIDKDLKRIDIDYYKNQTLPELNFIVSASHDLNTSTTLSTRYHDTLNEYGLSFEFELPIAGYRSHKKSLEISKLQLAKYTHNYQRKKKDLTAEIMALQQSLKEARTILNTYPNLINTSEKNRTQSLKNHQLGKHSIDEVIDAYTDELRVKLDSIDAKIDYQKDLIDLKNLLDCLLVSETHSPKTDTIISRL